jgi:hypothetical protein
MAHTSFLIRSQHVSDHQHISILIRSQHGPLCTLQLNHVQDTCQNDRRCAAQIWPNLPAPALWPSSMPPLLSPKVRLVAQLLADRQQKADAQLQQAGTEDRWAAIVFVETKVKHEGLSAAGRCR